MGAAVDNEEVSLILLASLKNPLPWSALPSCPVDETNVKSAYGEAIQNVVEDFYNLVNSEDNVLQCFLSMCRGGNRH